MLLSYLLPVLLGETILFLWGSLRRNWAIADVGWGLIPAVLCTYTITQSPIETGSFLLQLAVMLWGFRLAIYLLIRQWGKEEDFRYAAWRKSWQQLGAPYLLIRSFLQVFVLQGILLTIVLIPLYAIYENTAGRKNELLFWTGSFLWLIGWLTESISDMQKHLFRKNASHAHLPCNVGLWKYSRHANYLGEIILWWGIGLMGFSMGSIISLISPVVVTYLIIYVSGIPMLTEKYKRNPAYKQYLEETAPLIPGVKHWP